MIHFDKDQGRSTQFESEEVELPPADDTQVFVIWKADLEFDSAIDEDHWRSGYWVIKVFSDGSGNRTYFDLPSVNHVRNATRSEVRWTQELVEKLERLPNQTTWKAPEFQPIGRVA